MTLLFVEIPAQFWILAEHSRPYDLAAQLSLIPGIPQLLFCILSGVPIYILLDKFIWPYMFKHKELPGLFDNYSILPNKLWNTFDICNFVDRTTILDLHLLFLKREHTFIIYHIAHILSTCCVVTPANVVITVLWDQHSYEENESWRALRYRKRKNWGKTMAWEPKGHNTGWQCVFATKFLSHLSPQWIFFSLLVPSVVHYTSYCPAELSCPVSHSMDSHQTWIP